MGGKLVVQRVIDISARRHLAEIVNLNRARKAKKRRKDESLAAANRVRFGRSKQDRAADRATQERSERSLDGKVLTGKPTPPDGSE